MKPFVAAVAVLGALFVHADDSARVPSGVPGVDELVSAEPLGPRPLPSIAYTPALDSLSDVVQAYCVRCHNERRMTGNLSLDGFQVAGAATAAETAEKMIVKLRAGMMPPPGARRPAGDTLAVLAETLETLVDDAASLNPNPGSRRFQRLNRAEYERAVFDLLDLAVDAGRWLPEDTYLGNFDNLSAAQGLSTTLLEAYMRAATEVSRLAVGNPNAPSSSVKYTNPIETSQHAWDRLDGAPIGTRGGMVVTHDFPADGEYVLTVETLFGRGTGGQDLDISIDGEGVARLALEHGEGGNAPIRTEPIFIRAGQRTIAAAFVRTMEGPYEDRLSPFDWSFVGGEDATQWANYGITALPHLAELMITGPESPTGVSETPSRNRIFTCRPQVADDAERCARSIVEQLATRAYRRRVDDRDLAGPMAFFEQGYEEGDFEIGVRTALQAILASPSFLFRLEEPPAGVEAGDRWALSGPDLAVRLAFFLWGSGPDDELIRAGAEGRLTDGAELEAQTRRLLADPRSESLATRFASQWLRLQEAKKNQPELYQYPDFTGQLGNDLVRETQLFFDHLVRNDLSLLELYTADYSFMNERTAAHYGIGGVEGSHFRRVAYPDDRRVGVLGHGSVLLLTSMSARTSPVLRGKWVMEVLMGAPPPPPPPNVPNFEETASADADRPLSTKERMERHRANPTCNACHRLMDPIGLALDNFDVTGQWRVRENGVALDTHGTYYDGTPLSSPAELVDLLMKRPEPLVRAFTSNLLAYAVGRRVEYFDQPTVREISRAAASDDYRLSSFILGVVRSDAFRMMRSEAVETAEGDAVERTQAH